jgi:hypothetical protein
MVIPKAGTAVVRPRRERRQAQAARHSIELSPIGQDIVGSQGDERTAEATPTKEQGSHEVQADLVPVDKKDHLGLISTT